MSDRIDVLDHGFVRLVDSMGGDLSISRAARVSYDAAWRAGENEGGDAKLIRYLWDHAHTTPFESVTLTFEVKAPIFVFRQWHRHRTWAYNELSARYKELPEEFYVPNPDHLGKQSDSNKQARDFANEFTDKEKKDAISIIRTFSENAFAAYRILLARGVPRELARSILPVNTYSHMFATVSLLNLFRFLTLRADEHAQYEIRVYADAMAELAAMIAPVALEAWRSSRQPKA
jgi:thymidylate synthase (FAD)